MKALVLCAGKGTRLGDLTRDVPKPMLPVGGEPLLAHTLRHLAAHGITDVAVNLHTHADQFTTHFGDGAAHGVRIRWSYETEMLGTAGALRPLGRWIGDDAVLVVYGDLLFDEDLAPLLRAHAERDAFATLLVHQRAASNSIVDVDVDGRITAFVERPTEDQRRAPSHPWVNSGVQVVGPAARARIPVSGPADLPRDVYVPAAGREAMYAVPRTGYRCAVDSPARYTEARSAFAEGRCRPRRA